MEPKASSFNPNDLFLDERIVRSSIEAEEWAALLPEFSEKTPLGLDLLLAADEIASKSLMGDGYQHDRNCAFYDLHQLLTIPFKTSPEQKQVGELRWMNREYLNPRVVYYSNSLTQKQVIMQVQQFIKYNNFSYVRQRVAYFSLLFCEHFAYFGSEGDRLRFAQGSTFKPSKRFHRDLDKVFQGKSDLLSPMIEMFSIAFNDCPIWSSSWMMDFKHMEYSLDKLRRSGWVVSGYADFIMRTAQKQRLMF